MCFEYFYKQLSAFVYDKVTPDKIDELEMVSESLKLKSEETLVLAVIFYLQYERYPTDVDVINRLVSPAIGKNSDVYDVIKLFEKLEVLERDEESKVKIIRFTSHYFKLIKQSNLEEFSCLKPIGLIPMLNYFNVNVLRKRFQSMRSIINELEFMSELNPDLSLVKNVFKTHDTISSLIIGAICAKQVHERTTFNTSFISNYIFDYMGEVHYTVRSIAQGDWEYIKNGWVKISGDGLVNNEVDLELELAGINYFLSELNHEQMQEILIKDNALWINIIKPDAIAPVDLLFNENMKSSVRNLEGLCKLDFKTLEKDNIDIRGATVLLYGASGTGKTELALQLARKSERSLYKVEVNQIMSKWVGESEQKLKESLNKYKRMVKSLNVAPILFLNECDQVLSKRISINDSVDQMHNNLQNILLEEFEKFEGVLIATTNLTNNLDEAFERRFLYKVQFEKPTACIQIKLWKQYLPGFADSELVKLMNRFDFTAAEIKNIARKLALTKLIENDLNEFQLVESFCENERINSSKPVKIGF